MVQVIRGEHCNSVDSFDCRLYKWLPWFPPAIPGLYFSSLFSLSLSLSLSLCNFISSAFLFLLLSVRENQLICFHSRTCTSMETSNYDKRDQGAMAKQRVILITGSSHTCASVSLVFAFSSIFPVILNIFSSLSLMLHLSLPFSLSLSCLRGRVSLMLVTCADASYGDIVTSPLLPLFRFTVTVDPQFL